MDAVKEVKKFLGGYPGGWKQYARGFQGEETPPFEQPTNPDDRRSLIPPLGLREYWYPALPAADVSAKKPVALRLLGQDLTFFRDQNGHVQALWDYCPHRGVYLSWGDCFYNGFLTCPYHGATFNGDGECVEFLTEGPDSKMVGRLQAKKFPTRTLKGYVFVWMGEGEPSAIEEDVPPEFFQNDEELRVNHTARYWHCNWMVALENQSDAHNCFFVHRDALIQLRSRFGGRPRTPVGYRSRIVNGKAAINGDSSRYGVRVGASPGRGGSAAYYAGEDGKVPYQMYYPRVNGVWPLHRKRLLWTWFFEYFDRKNMGKARFDTPEEWSNGMHLPGMQRLFFGGPGVIYTRWCVPVEPNLTRVVYFRGRRVRSLLGRFYDQLAYHLYRNFLFHYNFSDQDYDAMRSTQYQLPEYLSSTDSHVVAQRRLVTEYGRGIKRTVAVKDVTSAEKLVLEGTALLGQQVAAEHGSMGGLSEDVVREAVTAPRAPQPAE